MWAAFHPLRPPSPTLFPTSPGLSPASSQWAARVHLGPQAPVTSKGESTFPGSSPPCPHRRTLHKHTQAQPCVHTLTPPHTPALAHVREACGIFSLRPGMEPAAPGSEGEALTAGLPGKPLYFVIYSPCFLPPPPSKAAAENSRRLYSTAPLMETPGWASAFRPGPR